MIARGGGKIPHPSLPPLLQQFDLLSRLPFSSQAPSSSYYSVRLKILSISVTSLEASLQITSAAFPTRGLHASRLAAATTNRFPNSAIFGLSLHFVCSLVSLTLTVVSLCCRLCHYQRRLNRRLHLRVPTTSSHAHCSPCKFTPANQRARTKV